MAEDILFHVSVTVAMVFGTAAGVLAVLTWDIFRTSPFGRALALLTVAMATFTLYHGALLVVHGEPLVVRAIESLSFTGLAVFIALVIRLQYRLNRQIAATRNAP